MKHLRAHFRPAIFTDFKTSLNSNKTVLGFKQLLETVFHWLGEIKESALFGRGPSLFVPVRSSKEYSSQGHWEHLKCGKGARSNA